MAERGRCSSVNRVVVHQPGRNADDAEHEARARRVGLRQDKDSVPPWEWRRFPKGSTSALNCNSTVDIDRSELSFARRFSPHSAPEASNGSPARQMSVGATQEKGLAAAPFFRYVVRSSPRPTKRIPKTGLVSHSRGVKTYDEEAEL